MGVMIGSSGEFSTWGRCRTPIYKTYFDYTGGSHNAVSAAGWASQAMTFFRCANWPAFVSWVDSGGVPQTGIQGAIAYPGPPFPSSVAFYLGGFNTDPSEPYAPNYLDDVEVQNYWVGRDVVIDSTTYAMSYSALNGVTGSFQTITPSASVTSFDL